MKKRNPRHGSMQFWPRVRTKNENIRIRSWKMPGNGLLGFSGYKVGMTHLIVKDNRAKSTAKGESIFYPATVIECPPLKAISIRFYKKTNYGLNAVSQIKSDKLDSDLKRKLSLPKKPIKNEEPKDFDDLTLIVHTQPKLTGIGKKKAEIFELGLGGKKEDKLKYAKEKLGNEINIDELFYT
jgi:large subunit ribosomal protein L3